MNTSEDLLQRVAYAGGRLQAVWHLVQEDENLRKLFRSKGMSFEEQKQLSEILLSLARTFYTGEWPDETLE